MALGSMARKPEIAVVRTELVEEKVENAALKVPSRQFQGR
jgi:hypothetical protein